MANPLPFVEIPGFGAAVRREQELRDLSFLELPQDIAGIPVRAFTLRDFVALDAMKNAHVVAFHFESELERVVQAMQFLWFMSTEYRVPRGWLDHFWMRWRQACFVRRAGRIRAGRVFESIKSYLADAFYDNPYSGGGESGGATLKAAFVVYIVDQLYAAGYPWSEREIFDMPLQKLWQYVRLAGNRLNPELALANRSDLIAVNFIEEQNKVAAAARAKEAARG